MSKFIVKVDHIPNFNEYQLSAKALAVRLNQLDLRAHHLWDGQYYYVKHENWGKIFADVLLNLPKYTTDKFDCEDFALLVTARVLEKYKLNTCGIAIGDSPMGYHGFNIFLSELGLFYLEPQNGDVFFVKENSGYKADLVIMG